MRRSLPIAALIVALFTMGADAIRTAPLDYPAAHASPAADARLYGSLRDFCRYALHDTPTARYAIAADTFLGVIGAQVVTCSSAAGEGVQMPIVHVRVLNGPHAGAVGYVVAGMVEPL